MTSEGYTWPGCFGEGGGGGKEGGGISVQGRGTSAKRKYDTRLIYSSVQSWAQGRPTGLAQEAICGCSGRHAVPVKEDAQTAAGYSGLSLERLARHRSGLDQDNHPLLGESSLRDLRQVECPDKGQVLAKATNHEARHIASSPLWARQGSLL